LFAAKKKKKKLDGEEVRRRYAVTTQVKYKDTETVYA
jgi:hypothetical protein